VLTTLALIAWDYIGSHDLKLSNHPVRTRQAGGVAWALVKNGIPKPIFQWFHTKLPMLAAQRDTEMVMIFVPTNLQIEPIVGERFNLLLSPFPMRAG
jgi:hypothetical protein